MVDPKNRISRSGWDSSKPVKGVAGDLIGPNRNKGLMEGGTRLVGSALEYRRLESLQEANKEKKLSRLASTLFSKISLEKQNQSRCGISRISCTPDLMYAKTRKKRLQWLASER